MGQAPSSPDKGPKGTKGAKGAKVTKGPKGTKGPNRDVKCRGGSCLTPKGAYKAGYLKKRWEGTERDGYRYSVGYAPTSAATCRCGCGGKIPKGAVRVGRSTPSPFDAEGGHADFTRFFLLDHAFDAFLRSRATSRVPTRAQDLAGLAALKPADRTRATAAVAAFARKWEGKKGPKRGALSGGAEGWGKCDTNDRNECPKIGCWFNADDDDDHPYRCRPEVQSTY